MLKDDFSIEINPVDMSASSLVYVLNHLGIKTSMACGGHYKEHTMVFGGYNNTVEPFPFTFPWVSFSHPAAASDELVSDIEGIAAEYLWYVEHKAPNPYYRNEKKILFLYPDHEFFDYAILKREHIQQTQLEMVLLASMILERHGNNHEKRKEIVGAIEEHYRMLSDEISFLKKLSQ